MFTTTLFVLATAVCIVAQLAILRAVAAGRVPGASRAPGEPPRRAAEVAWAVLPAAMLALVLFLTWRSVEAARGDAPAAPAHALES